jgi:hypothetical protein
MIFKLISTVLILFTAFMGIKHGWSALNPTPENSAMMESLKLSTSLVKVIGVLTFAGAILILFPSTFFWGNILNACLIVLMMGLFMQAKDYKFVAIEIPFLLIPLILIYLKHPLSSE